MLPSFSSFIVQIILIFFFFISLVLSLFSGPRRHALNLTLSLCPLLLALSLHFAHELLDQFLALILAQILFLSQAISDCIHRLDVRSHSACSLLTDRLGQRQRI